MKIELTPTDDGSPTLYLPDLDEHYHSTKGAVTESRHVYLQSGLIHRLTATQKPQKELRILEIGFGTGLNAALAAEVCRSSNGPIRYISLEKNPLDEAIVSQLDFGPDIDRSVFNAIHSSPWNTPVEILPGLTLEKRTDDFLHDLLPSDIDVVFMDAFGPDKQPEMWTTEALRRLVDTMAPGAVLTTYSAKGVIRRTFKALGLTVERLPGPPGGKREILRATKALS